MPLTMSIGKLGTMRLGEMLRRTLGVILAALFLYAGFEKILYPRDFAEAIFNYQILPERLVTVTAVVLPWLEALAGLCILTGFKADAGMLVIAALLAAFSLALAFNLWRGLNVDCGCFGGASGPAQAKDMWLTLFRDVAMLAGCAWWWMRRGRGGSRRPQ